MKVEIPVFKRCCFCLPLRYGLLAWGYFTMIADAILLSILTYYVMTETLLLIRMYDIRVIHTEYILQIIAIFIYCADFVVTIVFIVGGHMKNVKLIRVFYFFRICMLVIPCLLIAFNVVLVIHDVMTSDNWRYWAHYTLTLPLLFVVLAVQSYFLILLRSEIIKLRNNSVFRFVNSATEPECIMTCEENVVGEETVKEVVVN